MVNLKQLRYRISYSIRSISLARKIYIVVRYSLIKKYKIMLRSKNIIGLVRAGIFGPSVAR